MKDEFKELLLKIEPIGDMLLINLIEDDIVKHYFQYFRRYHTYEEHIEPGLKLLESVRGLCKEPLLVELAWWYHDVVYIPGSPNSEVISADKAYYDCTQLGYGQKIASTVHNLVMATQHFKTEPHTQDEKIIHDLDLAILGSSPEDYKRYEKLIREEYNFVNDKDFSQGRLEVLKHFLQRSGSSTNQKKTLFITKYFQDNYEKKAIENIHNEIDRIKSFSNPE